MIENNPFVDEYTDRATRRDHTIYREDADREAMEYVVDERPGLGDEDFVFS